MKQVHPLPENTSLNPSRQAFFEKNAYTFENLIKAGFTIRELNEASDEQLKKLFKNFIDVSFALRFLTKNQMLGIDHVPMLIPESNEGDTPLVFIGAGGRRGNFISSSIETIYDGSRGYGIQVKVDNATHPFKGDYTCMPINEKIKNTIDKSTENVKITESLIHDWIILKGSPIIDQNIFYCPDNGKVVVQSCDPGFPRTELEATDMLHSLDYYKEKHFIKCLEKYSITVAQLKAIPGMTTAKLDILCTDPRFMGECINAGMTFNDFAAVEEKRLKYIVSIAPITVAALKFVDIFELFSLRSTPPLLNLYATRKATTPQPESFNGPRRTCSIL